MGRTGLNVSALCLGTVPFGSQVDETAARGIVSACLDGGINFFDTANSYNDGRSEEIVGALLEGRRHEVVIATKVQSRVGSGVNDGGLSRAHIMRAAEDSLRRLRTDYIDLYQAHWPDYETPLEETAAAMDDLVRQGKVRYVGCSNYPAWYLARSLWISDVRNLARIDCVQPRYNLLDRSAEAELYPLCLDQGVGVIPYNPIAGGFLTGKYRRGEEAPPGTRFAVRADIYMPRYWNDANFDALERLVAVASGAGLPPGLMALAWSMRHPAVTSSIVGATSPEQVNDNLKAVDLVLTDEQAAALEPITGDAH